MAHPDIDATQVAEFQWNALEMARKADLAERRAEDAEVEVERLRDHLARDLSAALEADGHAGTLTGNLAVDMAAYATRLKARVDETEAAIERVMRLYHEAIRNGRTLQPTAVRDALICGTEGGGPA